VVVTLLTPTPNFSQPSHSFETIEMDVGQAFTAGDAPFLDEHKPEQAGLAQRILDGGS
jgi:hypothetical protein